MGRDGWSEGREREGKEERGMREGVRMDGVWGGSEGRERGGKRKEGGSEDGWNNCGVVLVVNIYYKLWKERHRTHNNG